MKPGRGQIETMVEQLAQQPELFVRMEALLAQVSSEQTGSLDQAEEAVVKQLRALGQEALSVWMRERAAGIEAPAGARRGVKKKLRCLTTLGWIETEEQTWRRETRTLRPVRQRLGVSPRACSRRLQRALTDFGADEAFAAAAAKVHEHYRVQVNPERVRQVCLHHATRLAARPVHACARLRPSGPDWIVAEADGTMLPIVDTSAAPPGADRRKHRSVRWQEARVLAARALGETGVHYEATFGEVGEAGARWSRTVRAAGRGVNTRIHAVGDGAPWIEQQAATHLGPRVRYLLDLYHVCDYLAAVWPGDRTVVARHRDALKAGRIESVFAALRQRLEPAHLSRRKRSCPVRLAIPRKSPQPTRLRRRPA